MEIFCVKDEKVYQNEQEGKTVYVTEIQLKDIDSYKCLNRISRYVRYYDDYEKFSKMVNNIAKNMNFEQIGSKWFKIVQKSRCLSKDKFDADFGKDLTRKKVYNKIAILEAKILRQLRDEFRNQYKELEETIIKLEKDSIEYSSFIVKSRK